MTDLPKHILGALMAAAACVACWFLRPLMVFAPQIIPAVPVLMAFACAYSGWYWGAAGAVGAAVCAGINCGWDFGAACALGMAVPVGVQYFMYMRRVKFERALMIQACSLLALGFAALMLLRITRGDLTDLNASYVRELWDSQISFDVFGGGMMHSLVNRQKLLSIFAAKGYLSNSLLQELMNSPSSDVYARCIDYVIYTMRYVTGYTLTGNLASMALGGGVVMTAWPRMIAVRKGVSPEMPFVSLRDWFMPTDMAKFACIAYALTSLLLPFMPEWWYATDNAIKQCVRMAMMIQGVAATERQLRSNGVRRGLRGAMLFMLTATFGGVVALIGVGSALFGSHGAISGWLRRKMEENDDDDK